MARATERIKEVVDRVAAAGLLVATAPLAALSAGAVAVSMGRPVLFRQRRPGLHGAPFELLKFRTMSDARGPDGKLLPDHERMTRVGRFLRRTSLDELPQLWNVLKGDLSLVGPRPLLMAYLERYTPRQARRHHVKPGITGWAQINGRNAISWDEKFELDVWYVENWSLFLDLKILARTALQVVRGSDVSSPGHVTMPEYMGPKGDNASH